MANHVSAYHDVEYRMLNAEGDYVWVNCKGYMTYDEEGNMDFLPDLSQTWASEIRLIL